MNVVVTRDSVAAGDDCDAPHVISFVASERMRVKDVFKHLARLRYLPHVAGRGHSWEALFNERKVASFVANKRRPKFSMLLFTPLTEFVIEGNVHIHLHYKSAGW